MNPSIKVIFFVVLSSIVGYFSAHPQSAPVKTDLTFSGLLGALGGLLILVLLIERVTEIVISIWREAETNKMKGELAILESDQKQATAAANKKSELSTFQAQTKVAALTIGFALSVVACAGGVGILETILSIDKAEPTFIRGIDIVLTSGLLAGGSDVFHQFVRSFETFFKDHNK